MKAKDRDQMMHDCQGDILTYKLSSALAKLHAMIHHCKDNNLKDTLANITDSYNSMLSFLCSGGKDEHHEQVQDDLRRACMNLVRRAHRDLRLQDATSLYSRCHTRLTQTYGSMPESTILRKWGENIDSDERTLLQDHLFDLLWTMPLWQPGHTAGWFEFISRQNDMVKHHLLSAVFLSAWEYFDEEKVTLLRLFSEAEETEASGSAGIPTLATIALTLLIHKYALHLHVYPNLEPNITLACQRSIVARTAKECALMLLTMNDIKQEEEELKQVKDNDNNKEKLERITEIYLRHAKKRMLNGMDASLSSRMLLIAQSPFLQEVSHWWLPFNTKYPQVQQFITDEAGHIDERFPRLVEATDDCDVDKFAIVETLTRRADTTKVIEEMEAMLGPDFEPTAMPTCHERRLIQNFYRFFHLSPLRREIDNPFAWNSQLIDNPLLTDSFTQEDVLEICKILIEAKEYDAAWRKLDALSHSEGADANLFRLMGRCWQEKGQCKRALLYYQQADILEEDDADTLRRMQHCYEELKMWSEQLCILERLCALAPEDTSISIEIAKTLIHMKRYEDALQILYRLDYQQPGERQTEIFIAHCALHLRKFDVAEKYTEKSLAQHSVADSWTQMLTAGHIRFMQGDWTEARLRYVKFFQMLGQQGASVEQALTLFEMDEDTLTDGGVSIKDVELMKDMVLHSL